MYNLPAGLNQAVKKMQRGEISRIGCAHDLALGEHVWEKLKLKKQVNDWPLMVKVSKVITNFAYMDIEWTLGPESAYKKSTVKRLYEPVLL